MKTIPRMLENLAKDVVSVRPNIRQSAAWIALIALILVGAMVTPSIVSPDHWPTILRQCAPLGLLAVGQTLLVLCRSIDLSVGGVVGMVNVLAAGGIADEYGALGVIVVCLLMGLTVGVVNGGVVAWAGISPLIATLAMGFVLTGGMLIYTGGAPTGTIPAEIRILSSGRAFGLAWSVYIWLAVTLVAGIILRFTWIGRWIIAAGTNPRAAEVSRVSVRSVLFGTHIVSSLCAVVGGILLAGFVGVGTLGAGQELLMNSLAATVLGGTLLAGGRGGLTGTVGGVIVLTLLAAILTALGLGEAGKLLVLGIIIVIAAGLFRKSARG